MQGRALGFIDKTMARQIRMVLINAPIQHRHLDPCPMAGQGSNISKSLNLCVQIIGHIKTVNRALRQKISEIRALPKSAADRGFTKCD